MRSFVAVGLAVLAFGSSAGAAVQTGQSGWSWTSPAPQGNTLWSVAFAEGGRGYAAGDFGTVLRTDDGGQTWTGLPTGRTLHFGRAAVLGRDSLVVGGGCTLRRSDDAGATWHRLPFAPSESSCSPTLADFAFPSGRVGYLLLADGAILRTDDGGDTFSRRTSVPGGLSIAFSSAGTGLVGGGGRIVRTTDGGSSWTDVASGNVRGVAFATSAVAYATLEGGRLLRSDDGGLTWERRAMAGAGSPGLLRDLRCAGTEVCLVTTASGALLRTDDGGRTASAIAASDRAIRAAAFADGNRATAVGMDGATAFSSTAGASFATVGGRLEGRYTRLRRGPGNLVLAVGLDGALARSGDGGHTWVRGSVSTTQDVVDASFASASRGWALDASGTLLRTDNAGASWRILTARPARSPRAVIALSANTVLLAGPAGVERSTNGGEGFDPVSTRGLGRWSVREADHAGSAVVLSGPRNLAVSTDGGRRWRQISRPTRRRALLAADFVSARIGFALVEDGRLWRTRNGGRTWSESAAIGGVPVVGLAFSSSRTGWALAEGFPGRVGGWLLRTDDAGRTWRPQLAGPEDLYGPSFGTPTLVALSARQGVVFSPGREEADDDYGTGTTLSGPQSFFVTTRSGDLGRESRLTLSGPSGPVKRGRAVRLRGRLAGARGGETVVVFTRPQGTVAWSSRTARVASNGTFIVTVRPLRKTVAVAQFTGGDGRAPAGTPMRTIRVGA